MSETTWKSVEPLLDSWRTKARTNQHAHYESSKHCGRLNLRLGVPAIILSAFVGTGVFATLQEEVDPRARVAVGVVSVVVAVLTSLQTFLRFAERAARHRKAANGYASVRREIETLLAVGAGARGEPTTIAEGIRNRLDALADEAPEISVRGWASSAHARDTVAATV